MSAPHDVLVAAGVLVRDPATGDVLLQLRGDDATWGLPGWRIEPGETLEQAARRVLLKETGLRAGDLRCLDVFSGPEFVVRYPDAGPASTSDSHALSCSPMAQRGHAPQVVRTGTGQDGPRRSVPAGCC